MKPSTKLSELVKIKMRPQMSAGRHEARQVPTLYRAAGGLLLVAAVISAAAAPTSAAMTAPTAAASKSIRGPQMVVADGDRQSSSPAASSLVGNVASNKEDHHLALPSSTTSAQLVPVRHLESSASLSARTNTRSADLNIGQSNIANAKVHASPKDMTTAAGHHYGKSHGKYYMYAEVPKKGAFKAGFKRGNHKHMIERKESQHKSHNHGYFKWHDKKGKGSHKWEYKHYDKKGKHHHY